MITSLENQLIDTWQIHSRINLYLLQGIDPAVFSASPPTTGRNVGQMFAHIHNVRLLWLQSSAPALTTDLSKIESKEPLDADSLHAALTASAKAIENLLLRSLETGKVKGFKPHATAFVGYLIAHESYHHGEIGIAVREAGYPLDKKVAYGLWEWGSR